MAPRRSGFTLVELLVVIAIIGVLVALLLPAVQAAREAANRSSCGNNFKQLGLALHNYHDTFKILPPGAFWQAAVNGDNFKGSGLLHILPFMEEGAIYDRVDFRTWNGNVSASIVENTTMADGTRLRALKLSGYKCPSDMQDRNPDIACSNYSLSAGSCKVGNNPGHSCAEHATWSAWTIVGHDDREGKMFNRVSYSHAFAECTDGLSNTIFVGEVRRGCSAHVEAGWLYSNDGNGLTSTVVPINYDSCELTSGADKCKYFGNWSTELGYKSRHPGGCQMGLGDGSVRFFPETIDHQNYQYLGNPMDKQVAVVP